MRPTTTFRAIATAVLLSAMGAQMATANVFLANKADWDQQGDVAQQGYAMGAFDAMQMFGGTPEFDQFLVDMAECVRSFNLRAFQFVEIIDRAYQDPERAGLPPSVLLGNGLRNVCLANINSARVARGEDPLSE